MVTETHDEYRIITQQLSGGRWRRTRIGSWRRCKLDDATSIAQPLQDRYPSDRVIVEHRQVTITPTVVVWPTGTQELSPEVVK